ncbi:MAG: hypothetical protein RIB61_16485 [Roseicyclus sp.]
MQRRRWSTDTVRQADRFDVWKHVICDEVLNVEAYGIQDNSRFGARRATSSASAPMRTG